MITILEITELAITKEDVKAGVRVRVLANTCCAPKPGDARGLLKPGDIVTLFGTLYENISGRYAAHYTENRNYILLSEVELVDSPIDSSNSHPCQCPSHELFAYGCRCGGV